MVCPLGSGRMATMASLLDEGNFSQAIAEELGNQKLAADIHRELREADEANLLDEEDMHVFDLKPMTDPLHLVRCNACKKPIKASQYAAHSELCKSLCSAVETVSELDGGSGHKKPPRKERRKLLTLHATTSGREQERFEPAEANDVALSDFHVDEQIQMTSFSIDGKRNSSCADGALITDRSGVSPGNADHSTGAMPPPTKRSKLIAAQGLPISDHLETASGVAKSLCIRTQEAHTCREFREGSSGPSKKNFDCSAEYQIPGQVHECCLLSKDVPAPLATKMFYSQRDNRLRSALKYLYYETSSSKEHSDDLVDPKSLQGNEMPLQVSSLKTNSNAQTNVRREKKQKQSLPSVQKPEQFLEHSSDVSLGKLGGSMPAVNFSNLVPVNVKNPQTAPAGVMRSNYLSKPFSFAGNSGTTLGTMQQPKGSVPVT